MTKGVRTEGAQHLVESSRDSRDSSSVKKRVLYPVLGDKRQLSKKLQPKSERWQLYTWMD